VLLRSVVFVLGSSLGASEGVGFEPTVPLRARLISSQVPSTNSATLPSDRVGEDSEKTENGNSEEARSQEGPRSLRCQSDRTDVRVAPTPGQEMKRRNGEARTADLFEVSCLFHYPLGLLGSNGSRPKSKAKSRERTRCFMGGRMGLTVRSQV
jgi:hypothetical protein